MLRAAHLRGPQRFIAAQPSRLPPGVSLRSMLHLLREPRTRLFFFAHALSSAGAGAGYAGLLLIAYQRHPGPWGITLVLLAEFLPAIVLGPIFGAAADRWSRRVCAVLAELTRAAALISIAFVDSIEATVALALVAGFGAGLFQPSILAGLPSLVVPDRVPAAMSLYGAVREIGTTAGPALAAIALIAVDAETLVLADGITFAVSAAALAVLPLDAGREARAEAEGAPSLLADAREGIRAARRLPGVSTLILATSAVLLFAGMLNVAELLFARNELHVGDSGFSVMIALGGAGIVIGSALGARPASLGEQRRRYLAGMLMVGAALVGLSVAPGFGVACVAVLLVGVGNGLVLVYGRVLVQRIVPAALLGRVFGIKDSLISAAFGIAFLAAGALIELIGVREVLTVAGAGTIAVWATAALLLRRSWPAEAPAAAV
jgi:MFS family permease